MKQIACCLIAFFTVIPCVLHAQVEKQVEVTKAYVPSVERAAKLPVEPNMVDTVKMRPDIDYSITPLSLTTGLETRPIKPATVTYWQFNRPQTFYIKAGAGYPLNSVLDFYASSQNQGTGYVVGYINHEGRYADIKNDFGDKHNSVRMLNRIGAAAGLYLGKRTLEGDLSYANRLYHRYGTFQDYFSADNTSPDVVWYLSEETKPDDSDLRKTNNMIDYGDVDMKLRFGDDFKDLNRVNFDIALHGNLFMDHSDAPEYENKARQTTLGAQVKVARSFEGHTVRIGVGIERLSGAKSLREYTENIINAGLRYGYQGGVVGFEAGADYYHDKINSEKDANYIIPFVKLDFNLGAPGIRPFVELDGGVQDNSYRSLTRLNPYVHNPTMINKSSVDYNARLGVGGCLFKEKLAYRLYAGFSVHDNHLYWGSVLYTPSFFSDNSIGNGYNTPKTGRQTVTSFNGEVEYRPVSTFHLMLGVHGYLYNDESIKTVSDFRGDIVVQPAKATVLGNGAPSFDGIVKAQYDGRKVSFGVAAQMQSARSWTELNAFHAAISTFTAPFAVDLRVNVDWRVSGRVTLFAEGRNLANQKLYEYPFYPEYGANCTVGIKASF